MKIELTNKPHLGSETYDPSIKVVEGTYTIQNGSIQIITSCFYGLASLFKNVKVTIEADDED